MIQESQEFNPVGDPCAMNDTLLERRDDVN